LFECAITELRLHVAMQIGLYLHPDCSGVWHVVSEGSVCIQSSLLIVRTSRFSLLAYANEYLKILGDSSIWPNCLYRLLDIVPLILIFLFSIIGRMGAAIEDSAPPKLPATHGPHLVLR
jgi:hypothetical protein